MVVTRRAKNVVAIAAPIQNFPRDLEWKARSKLAVHDPNIKMFVRIQKTSRHDPDGQRPGGPMIWKEGALLERPVSRLLGHLLPARGKQKETEQEEKF
jgi:hypothetical protein